MTDKELLELAAKAALAVKTVRWTVPRTSEPFPIESEWDPLNDDGDALRLAVRLGLCILTHATQVEYSKGMGQVGIVVEQSFRNCAATRRAIVRAAAEIGREM